MISRASKSSVLQGFAKSRSMLAGNDAYMPSSFESIATASGTGSSRTITFSSIPSTFKHLQLRYIGKASDSATAAIYDIAIQFNSDTGANYAYHSLQGAGSSATASGGASANTVDILSIPNSVAALANMFGTGIIDILDYASTSKNKTVKTMAGYDTNATSPPGRIGLYSGFWNSTSAITSISLTLPAGSNWTTTSSFALYGIKG